MARRRDAGGAGDGLPRLPTPCSAPGVEVGPYVVFGPRRRGRRRRADPVLLPSRGRAHRAGARGSGRSPGCGPAPTSARARTSATSSRSRTRRIEAGAKANHLTYIGDARVGAGVQHRRRHDHLQLRRLRQVPDGDRRAGLHRLEHVAGRAGDDRRRRHHRRRQHDRPRRPAGQPQHRPRPADRLSRRRRPVPGAQEPPDQT